jgi:YbbR domain-containing protein
VKLRPRYPLQFLVSMLAACLLWYALAADRGEEISVRGVRAQLTLVNIPSDLVLISTVPDTVAVQLRGPLSQALDPRVPLEVLLDLSDARPGVGSYPINGSDVQLPSGVDNVEVVSVEPSSLTLELERELTRSVPLQPVVEGEPAPGFVIAEVRIFPSQITIQGPESRLAELEFVATTPVSIEGATGLVEAAVRPQIADPQLRVLTVAPTLVAVEVLPLPSPTPTPAQQRRR